MDNSLDVRMARCGFRSAIIRAETGLTRKQVASLRKRLGIVGPAESGPLPQAPSILSGKTKAMEASLFMLNYLYLAKTPRIDVDIDAVIAAHDQYFQCHAAIRNNQVDLENFLDIDDAWVVARDYRALEVMMRSCNGCHIQFVSSIHDSRQCCPICSGAVVRTDLFVCDAQAVSTHRTVSELVELSGMTLQYKNWGCTEAEICKEQDLNSDEYMLCLALSKLTNNHLAAISKRFVTGLELLSHYKQEGIGALRAPSAVLAVA